MDFVRHSPGWYAQKHPDDDFAETFAVWLDPTSAWREKYAGTGALAKLNYIGKVAARYGRLPPVSQSGAFDMPVEKMTMTLDTWYERCRESYGKRPALPPALDIDLARLFPGGDESLRCALLRPGREAVACSCHDHEQNARRTARCLVLRFSVRR